LGKCAFVAYDLFVKRLAFYMGDQIDESIEILPVKSLQGEMSSGVPYYEGELDNVVRQGRGVPAVPLVITGVESWEHYRQEPLSGRKSRRVDSRPSPADCPCQSFSR